MTYDVNMVWGYTIDQRAIKQYQLFGSVCFTILEDFLVFILRWKLTHFRSLVYHFSRLPLGFIKVILRSVFSNLCPHYFQSFLVEGRRLRISVICRLFCLPSQSLLFLFRQNTPDVLSGALRSLHYFLRSDSRQNPIHSRDTLWTIQFCWFDLFWQ